MDVTFEIDDALIKKSRILTGIDDASTLVRLGLESLIARESGRRLAKLGGSQRDLNVPPRRRLMER